MWRHYRFPARRKRVTAKLGRGGVPGSTGHGCVPLRLTASTWFWAIVGKSTPRKSRQSKRVYTICTSPPSARLRSAASATSAPKRCGSEQAALKGGVTVRFSASAVDYLPVPIASLGILAASPNLAIMWSARRPRGGRLFCPRASLRKSFDQFRRCIHDM